MRRKVTRRPHSVSLSPIEWGYRDAAARCKQPRSRSGQVRGTFQSLPHLPSDPEKDWKLHGCSKQSQAWLTLPEVDIFSPTRRERAFRDRVKEAAAESLRRPT